MGAETDAAQRVRVRVRPKFSLLGNAFAAVLLGTTPIFAVVYWFASTRGGMELAVVSHLVVLGTGLALVWRQLRVYCAVTDSELIGNGTFTPLTRARFTEVQRVLLVRTYIGAAPDPVLQLLAVGADGRRLFRMRGNFWHEADLRAVAAAMPSPTETPGEPLTMREFFTAYPGSAYWFENRRPLQAAILAVTVIAALVGAVWIMSLLGLPVRFL